MKKPEVENKFCFEFFYETLNKNKLLI